MITCQMSRVCQFCSRVKATEGAFRCKSQSQNGFDLLEENTVKMSYMYDNFTEKI